MIVNRHGLPDHMGSYDDYIPVISHGDFPTSSMEKTGQLPEGMIHRFRRLNV